MKVLITGGAGFIGHHLALHMKNKGHEVLAIGTHAKQKSGNIAAMQAVGIRFKDIDILSPKLIDEFREFVPEAVVHAAAVITVDKERDRNELIYHRTNALGTMNVLDALLKTGASNFVYMSTAAVYGNPLYLPIDERHPTSPISVYAASKLAGEAVALSASAYGVKTFIPRAFNAYGPVQQAATGNDPSARVDLVSRLLAAEEDALPKIAGDGKQTRDFIHVNDVASAIGMALENDWDGIYNLGSGIGTSMNELVETIIRLRKLNAKPEHDLNQDFGIRDSYADISKIIALGWKPRIPLGEGLKELINHT